MAQGRNKEHEWQIDSGNAVRLENGLRLPVGLCLFLHVFETQRLSYRAAVFIEWQMYPAGYSQIAPRIDLPLDLDFRPWALYDSGGLWEPLGTSLQV